MRTKIFAVLFLAGCFSPFSSVPAQAAPDSLSFNFVAINADSGYIARTRPLAGTEYGKEKVLGQFWNNLEGNDHSASSVINNQGKTYNLDVLWSCPWFYNNGSTAPTGDAVLFHAYMDDQNTGAKQVPKFFADVPYFSYDVYHYASTDGGQPGGSGKWRPVAMNGTMYTGLGGVTRVTTEITEHWGTASTARGNDITLKEGDNYIHVRDLTAPQLAIGRDDIQETNGVRCSFGAVQIVNTADSFATWLTGNTSLQNASWQNDLTGETGMAWGGYARVRLISDGGNHNLTAGGEKLADLMVIGGRTVSLTGGTLETGILVGDGTFRLAGGTLAANEIGFSLTQTAGIFAPGGVGVVGLSSFAGDYTLTGGTIRLDVLDTDHYDAIDVAGKLSLSNDIWLDVNYLGTAFDVGDVLDILNFGSAEGEANLKLTALAASFWALDSSANGYTLTLMNSLSPSGGGDGVPEPATWVLLLTGLAGVMCLRRQRSILK